MDRVGCGLWNIVIVKRPRARETEKKKKKKGKKGEGEIEIKGKREGIIEMRRNGRRDRCETTVETRRTPVT